ncbi:hypothetical protein FEM48_Zijuj04G0113100 [Ziziphus jujuba var. spinosa]|uniref:Uncharacterized protein n=1 Tax=Ziziphus jujuba var. spinosa TaxID=714518 RepID=A0A978VJK4_ZIZJJ|nr:hypothetical protein FEM48_Zijuj04G0113100 [Ziziphus jujuba var. spinosa]
MVLLLVEHLEISHYWEWKLTDQRMDKLVFGLPLLKRSTIDSSLKKISIHSNCLKYFFLESWFGIEAALSTPNLVWLHFVCDPQSIISADASNLLEASLSLSKSFVKKYLALVYLLSNMKFLEQDDIDYSHTRGSHISRKNKKEVSSFLT